MGQIKVTVDSNLVIIKLCIYFETDEIKINNFENTLVDITKFS